MAVKELNNGARKTQTLRMSMVMWKKWRTWYRTAEVIISPVKRENRGRRDKRCISADEGGLYTWSTLTSPFLYPHTQRLVQLSKYFSLTPTWINGATNDPPERIPCPVIKPVVELIKSFFCQEAGRTVVEVPEGEMKARGEALLWGAKSFNNAWE